jgi:TonB-dependent starch-binding outer membrane protein SusC
MKQTIFALLFFLSSLAGFAQELNVKGVVTSADDGQPIPGATVVVKGKTTGIITSPDGTYTLKVPGNATLIFSFVGLKSQEVAVNNRTTINVALASATEAIEEVVVVGYGTQKKSVVTGAISSVKSKDLEKVAPGRVEQSLQGRVSGVTVAANSGQPGSSSTIRVRGVTTFGDAGNNPLWVVDGVVVDAGGIGYLNQSDIESIEVLKDAASAAIYGTRAATGVILVTTKKGSSGKLTATYNGFFGSSAPAKILDLLNATQYATLMNEKSVAGGGNVLYSDLTKLGLGTDWQKTIFNTSAQRFSHEFSLSGGNDKSVFYFSFGVQNQEGIVATDISNFNQKSIRLNSTHKISKIFTFGETVGYTHQKQRGIGNTNSEFGGPLSSAINLDPITAVTITDPAIANASPYNSNPVIRDASGNPYGISSIVGQEMTNPLAYIQTRLGQYGWSDNFVGNAYVQAQITKKIAVKSSVGAKLAFWGDQGFNPVYYLSATYQLLKNNIYKNNNQVFNWNIENTATYTDKIGDHSFDVLLGQAYYVDNHGGGAGSTLYDLPVNNYQDASFNFVISDAANKTGWANEYTEHRLTSLFARANYNYKEKYLFTGIYRRDGSSRFGSNNKYGYFPSFSLGWVVSKEDFWKQNDILTNLKIRGGYGIVGNDAISDFGYLSTVKGGFNYTLGNSGNITTGYAPASLDNPDLRWEETSQANIGFEARLYKALTLTVDVYSKKTSGILRPITIPGYVGVSSSPVGNIADMKNNGVEVELGYNKKFGALNFSANGNVAFLKNEVTYVASDANYITGDASFQSMGAVTRTQEGYAYNSFYGYKTNGIFQNTAEINAYTNSKGGLIQPNARPGDFKWVDADGDGTITDKDKTFLGSSIPKYTFGLTLNFDYKGFDLMVFATGAAGNKIFQGLRRLDIGNANWQTEALSRWTADGSTNSYPRLTSNDTNGNFGNMSDFYLEKGDYLRLKVMQLGYSLPESLTNKIDASKVRFYVSSENLFTMTKYTGYDPEIGGSVFGIDKGVYPQARSFMLGVQVQF